jgi:ABC-type phosphate/phosphonate transport system ATPase subunit
LLEVKNLTKIYDDKVLALDDVTFKALDGQFMAAIGLSGSGKSTLLRCINRLVEPTSGQVFWDGVDLTAAPQEELCLIRRRIGMIFQHFNLVTRSSVLTNVLSGRLGYLNPVWSLVNHFPKEDINKALSNLRNLVGRRTGGQPRPGIGPQHHEDLKTVEPGRRDHHNLQPALFGPGAAIRRSSHCPERRSTGL